MEDLESLINAAASRAIAAKAPKRSAKSSEETKPEPRQLFLDPENWKRGRVIGLIHAETETLLGAFVEYLHKSVPGARKLVRADGPLLVEASERVEGSWWLGADRRPEPRQEWHERREAIVHLHLDALGVHAPAVEIAVSISYGGIARVELVQDTQFADGEGNLLLSLPLGTNILDVCSLDCKINIRKEVGL